MGWKKNSAWTDDPLHTHMQKIAESTKVLLPDRETKDLPDEIDRIRVEAWYNELNEIVQNHRYSSQEDPDLQERLTDLRDDIYSYLK